MASRTLRSGNSALRLQGLQSHRLASQPRHLRTLVNASCSKPFQAPRVPRALAPARARLATQTRSIAQPPTVRSYATTQRPTADAIIEEIQDLYEVAKDEFEIATDSTDSATIYAASDRESARDALNELCAVYYLYTVDAANTSQSTGVLLPGRGESGWPGEIPGDEIVAGQSLGERGPVIEPGFEPAEVAGEVREEVRRRIGQRIRELRNAVEMLEERAKAD